MATDELRVPLLGNIEEIVENESEKEEDIEIHYHMNDSKGKAASDHRLRDRVYQHNISLDDEELVGGELGLGVSSDERRRKKQFSGSEMIVAVFVVAFDTKKGKRKVLL